MSCTGLQHAWLHQYVHSTQHSLHIEGLSANYREIVVWEQIVLNGDVVTIFTKNCGNPLFLGNVATGSRIICFEASENRSPLRGASGMDGGDARRSLHLLKGLILKGPCTALASPMLQILWTGMSCEHGLGGCRAIQNQSSFSDLCLSGRKSVLSQAACQCLLQVYLWYKKEVRK